MTTSILLPELSLINIIGSLIGILISGIILYLSVKLVGGEANFKKSVILTAIMQLLNLIVLPLLPSFSSIFSSAIMVLVLYYGLWLILVMKFFKVSFWRAILVAIAQLIVAIILGIIGVITLVGIFLGSLILIK